MYDEIREVDPSAYVILEHFAPNSEETELIEHRATSDPLEPGMLVWSNHNFNYSEASMGYNTNSDFSWISYLNRGWTTASSVGYMESHDEERLNFKNRNFGNSSGSYDVRNIDTALDRMELVGAFYFTIPGPKMIWQFGELGYDYSINYCANGTIDPSCRVDPKPIAWDLGYFYHQNRRDISRVWRKLIRTTQVNPIFNTTTFTLDVSGTDGLKRIQLEDQSATGSQVKYVTILGNFDVVEKNIIPGFQETGTWFNMLDGSQISVNDVNSPILMQPGEYLLYANEVSVLNTPDNELSALKLFPNPATNTIAFNKNINRLTIYDLSGKLVKTINTYKLGNQISIEALQNGVYFVKTEDNKDISNLKFIKK